jgi:hypothetical protein
MEYCEGDRNEAEESQRARHAATYEVALGSRMNADPAGHRINLRPILSATNGHTAAGDVLEA